MTLRRLFLEMRGDLGSDRSVPSVVGRLFFDVGVQTLILFRLASYFGRRDSFLLRSIARVLHYWHQRTVGCHFNLEARIEPGCKWPHMSGIVIGEGVIVEQGATIYQSVTLGSHGRRGEPKGYPVVRAGAILYSGCVVLGKVEIGRGAVVGANAVVLASVPDGHVAVGVPAKILKGA